MSDSKSAVGMIEVEGVAGIIVAADTACKVSEVELLGWDSIGGFTTLFFRGSVADVEAALDKGANSARGVTDRVAATALNHPDPNSLKHVAISANGSGKASDGALGLIESRGYGDHVVVNDQITKATGVALLNVLSIQNRVVCSVVQGKVGAVRESLEMARSFFQGSERFLCAALLSHPESTVVRTFGEGG